MEFAEDLWAIIQRQRPESLYVCGDTAVGLATRWQEVCDKPITVTRQDPHEINADWLPSGVHQLAVITDTLERLGQLEVERFLGQLRNFGAASIAVVVVDALTPWDFNAFIGLGFRRFRRYELEQRSLYTYDIESYNRKREWNSPEHWANPENWGKYRW